MTFALTLVVVSALALLLLLWVAVGRRRQLSQPEDPAQAILPVDIEAFRNLIDPAEEQFLRTHLSRGEFHAVQRRRLLATLDYVRRASHNATILLRMGEAARRDADLRIAQAGQHLVDNALRLRLFTLFSMMRLYVGIALPGTRVSAGRLVENYQQLSGLARQLAVIRNPGQATFASTG
jgi:hypothetical protein